MVWVENIAGKRENAGHQHFLLFPQCFQKVSVSGSVKSGLCGKGLRKVSTCSDPEKEDLWEKKLWNVMHISFKQYFPLSSLLCFLG